MMEPPTLTTVPLTLSWVTCGAAPSKVSAVAPLVPSIGLKVIAVSSSVLTTSLVMSATWVTSIGMMLVAGVVPVPSLVVTVTVAAPL